MDEIKSDNSTSPQTCKWASWSLVLGISGIMSLVLCIFILPAIFSIMSIILGIVALIKINAGKGLLTGKGEAIAGIILGGLLAVISIPIMIGSSRHSNETSAARSLVLMTSVEARWRQQDVDNNGVKDYWTYDISCFYRALRPDNKTKVVFIPFDLASADANPARSDVFGDKHFRIADLPEATSIPDEGYYFQMMELDQNGNPYNQEKVNGVSATNNSRFAIVAYPAIYGSTGVYTFIRTVVGHIRSAQTLYLSAF